jgi:hypothetical protein
MLNLKTTLVECGVACASSSLRSEGHEYAHQRWFPLWTYDAWHIAMLVVLVGRWLVTVGVSGGSGRSYRSTVWSWWMPARGTGGDSPSFPSDVGRQDSHGGCRWRAGMEMLRAVAHGERWTCWVERLLLRLPLTCMEGLRCGDHRLQVELYLLRCSRMLMCVRAPEVID